MYHPEFASDIARQHRADLVREATASKARRRARRQRKAQTRRDFAWRTVQVWQFSH
jgi:hypothetical protein